MEVGLRFQDKVSLLIVNGLWFLNRSFDIRFNCLRLQDGLSGLAVKM